MYKIIAIFILFCFCFAQCHNFENRFKRFLQNTDTCINKSVKNIGYVGQGYNLMKGNPRSNSGLDPGFTNFQLISYEYPKEISESYGMDLFSIKPKGIFYEQKSQCSTRQTSKMYNTLSEYVSQLTMSVNVTSSPISNLPEFQNSETFQRVQQIMKKKLSFIVETQATCVMGTAEINTGSGDKPKLSQAFIDQLVALENSGYAEQSFYEFFNKVGTHVAVNIKLGSMFGYAMEISNSLLKSFNQANTQISSIALSFANKVLSNYQIFTSEENLLQDAILQWQSYQIGSHLPSDNDPQTWINTTMNNPMPVETKLISIDQFMTRYIGDAVGVKDMAMLIKKVQQYLQSYCPTYLSTLLGNQITCQFKNEDSFSETQTVVSLSDIKKSSQKKVKVIITETKSGQSITCINYYYYPYSDKKQKELNYSCSPMPRGFGIKYLGSSSTESEKATLEDSEFTLSYIADKDSWMIMRDKDKKCLRISDNSDRQLNYSVNTLENCDSTNRKQLFELKAVNKQENQVIISNNNHYMYANGIGCSGLCMINNYFFNENKQKQTFVLMRAA